MVVTLDRAAASRIPDLRSGLPVDDLRSAGWTVVGPVTGPSGTVSVQASHTFSRPAELPILMADIAGHGPAGKRPFQLAVKESHGFLADHYQATGAVDLTCSLACFDDPRLDRDVGYPLGLAPGQLRALLAGPGAPHITFGFKLSLPGTVSSGPTLGRAKVSRGTGGPLFTWVTPLGSDSVIAVSSVKVDARRVHQVMAAVGAGAVVVLVTVAVLLGRRLRRAGNRPTSRLSSRS